MRLASPLTYASPPPAFWFLAGCAGGLPAAGRAAAAVCDVGRWFPPGAPALPENNSNSQGTTFTSACFHIAAALSLQLGVRLLVVVICTSYSSSCYHHFHHH